MVIDRPMSLRNKRTRPKNNPATCVANLSINPTIDLFGWKSIVTSGFEKSSISYLIFLPIRTKGVLQSEIWELSADIGCFVSFRLSLLQGVVVIMSSHFLYLVSFVVCT